MAAAGAGNTQAPRKRKHCKQAKKRTRPGLPGRVHTSAITYFPAEQYHRRQGLNFCVRDGNRCDPLPVVTDKTLPPPSRGQDWFDESREALRGDRYRITHAMNTRMASLANAQRHSRPTEAFGIR